MLPYAFGAAGAGSRELEIAPAWRREDCVRCSSIDMALRGSGEEVDKR